MFEFLNGLLDSEFMPHGHCYMWKPEILWLHVVSDSMTTLSYFSIPFVLVYFARKRQDLRFRWVFLLFGAFIFLCGTTHVLEIWTVWNGTYRLTGIVKLATGIVSIGTAIALWPLVPVALKIPSQRVLQEANDDLMREVEQRRRVEITLIDYARELERTNKELEEFSFIVSHDLQEPLRKIQAYCDRIKPYSDQLDQKGNEYLDRMGKAVERMRRLINDLLALSRISYDEINWTHVDLSEIAREVTGDLEVRIEESGAQIKIEETAVVQADSAQMYQLFQNLIGNAFKFHKEGEAPHVRIYGQPVEGGLFEICVEDQGIGFEEAQFERILKPFKRLHGRSEYTGTGIGMAICKKILDRHNGRITARSSPGQGTTFIVRLPMKQATSHQRAPLHLSLTYEA